MSTGREAGARLSRKAVVLGVLVVVQLVALTDLGLATARYAGVVGAPAGPGASTSDTSVPAPAGAPEASAAAATRPTGLLPSATAAPTTAGPTTARPTTARSTTTRSTTTRPAGGSRSRVSVTTSPSRR